MRGPVNPAASAAYLNHGMHSDPKNLAVFGSGDANRYTSGEFMKVGMHFEQFFSMVLI
jgi:hypothetical protein